MFEGGIGDGLPPAFGGRQEVAIFAWGRGEKPADEALQEKLAEATPEERAAYIERQREIAGFYDGPGGP